MGCKEKRVKGTVEKRRLSQIIVVLFLTFLPLLSLSFDGTMISTARGSGYIPAPPTGPDYGFVNIEYQYNIITMNTNASWMFDWGDGKTTPWLRLGNGRTSIVQTHRWTSGGNYVVRVKFKNTMYPEGIWSDPLQVFITIATPSDYPPIPILMSGTVVGVNDTVSAYTLRMADPYGYHVYYRADFGDGFISNWTSCDSSESNVVVIHHWKRAGSFPVRFQTRSDNGLCSLWSSSLTVNIQNASIYTQNFMDLIVINGVTNSMTYQANNTGTFYNTSTGRSSAVHWGGQGTFLLDDDNDGKWDYEYTPLEGRLEHIPSPAVLKQQQPSVTIPWLWVYVIIGIIVGVITTIVVLIKTGYLYFYEEFLEK